MTDVCEDCVSAAINPRSPRYTSGCKECGARFLANSPSYFDSARAGVVLPTLRSELQYLYGNDWLKGYARVEHYASLMEGAWPL